MTRGRRDLAGVLRIHLNFVIIKMKELDQFLEKDLFCIRVLVQEQPTAYRYHVLTAI